MATTGTASSTWSPVHTSFANGNSGKVYRHGPRITVFQCSLAGVEGEGWAFQYSGLFGIETHPGYSTMAAAKAAALVFIGR